MSQMATPSAFILGLAAGISIVKLVEYLRRIKTSIQPAPPQDWHDARVVATPHPGWTPGQPQPSPYPNHQDYITVNPSEYDKASMYALVISTVVPRPVAFISSCNAAGAVNLSPYSYFNAACHNPFTVVIGINHSPAKASGKKDSLNNIEATGEFVINIISEWFVEAANHTCGDYPPEVDEMALAGLTPLPSEKVRPPRVAESAVQMECKVDHIHVVRDSKGAATCSIVIGRVVALHVSRAVAGSSPSGKLVVDLAKLRPVARCGGVTYARVTELYDIARPDAQGRYPPARPAPQPGTGRG